MHYGNLQKVKPGEERKYSITPHIPGGFISCDKLENLAKVAKKYNGVIKINSGQRILITNLREADLPSIWEELDMEPAVYTVNSVKNIEMCPAEFCKRCKVNTMPIAMKLMKKYGRKEMPCRTKIGVAACRNACGSVYSKDVGVIGDKTGLMVVAGGSGGYHPRVADVIKNKLSEEEALKIIDNIFQFYKQQAELGEKLSFMIDRIGLETFKKNVIK